jgi:ankyrin repeat protein
MAAGEGRGETVRWLLDHGVDPNDHGHDGVTALWQAAADGRANTVRLLLDRGADPNADALGFTVHYAGQQSGNPAVVALLRRAGAR